MAKNVSRTNTRRNAPKKTTPAAAPKAANPAPAAAAAQGSQTSPVNGTKKNPAVKQAKPARLGLKITGIALLLLVVAFVVVALLPRPQNFSLENPMRKMTDIPLLIAHGGGNQEFPDNTLEAFYNAYALDPDVMLETDVSITRDGVVLLSHDTRLDRKTNVTGYIINWNYSDLMSRKVDFGYTNETKSQVLKEGTERVKFVTGEDKRSVTPLDVTYPEGVTARDPEVFLATRLEDLLICFPENRINVEIKQSGEEGLKCLAAVLELLEKYDAWDRVVLASFHNEIYAEYQRLQAEGLVPETFMCSPGLGNAALFYVLQLLKLDVFYGEDTCVLQLPTTYELNVAGHEIVIDLATPELIEAAHRHNMAVHYWTIDDPDEMRELIELGADGIMTNYPHRLAEVYAEYQAE